jgi:hypothetical protein
MSSKPLTTKQQNILITKIPDDTYTEKQIYTIVDYIRDGSIKSTADFPEQVSKKNLTSVYKVLDIVDNRKNVKVSVESDSEAEEVEEKPKKKISKKPLTKAEAKKQQAEAKKQAKEAKKLANPTIYYKAGPLPKYHRRATMQEAVDNDKLMYWGIMKVDSRLASMPPKKNRESFDAKIKENMIKLAGLVGKVGFLKRKLLSHDLPEKEIKDIKQEILRLAEEAKALNETIKTMTKLNKNANKGKIKII